MGINLKPYLKLLRVKDWRAYFLIAFFGFLISKGFLFPLRDIILFYAIVLLFLAFGFSVNDCFDTKEDKYRQDRVNPVVAKEISFKGSLVLSVLPGVFGLTLSNIFGLKIFLFSLVGALLGFFYSAPPLRMKSKPWLDLISHGLFAGAFLIILPFLIFQSKLTTFHYLITFSVFYLSIILELRNHLEDYEVDKRAGLRTTVCVFGYQNSEKLLKYLVIFYPFGLFLTFLAIPWQYLVLFLISTFLFLLFFNRHYKSIKNYQLMDFYTIFSFGLLTIAKMIG